MNFNPKELEYLHGESFSNGYEFQVVKDEGLSMRLPYLVNITEGANVLHIGFTDHIPLIQKKIDNGQWLHDLLLKSCNRCYGIDVNKGAVDFVRDELGIDNVFTLDIVAESLPKEIKEHQWDFVLLGEVLEHIDNPVEFLTHIGKKLVNNAQRIIITVPNAWDRTNLIRIKKGIEFINTDHRFWFTPYTLSKVLTRAGFVIEDVRMVQSYMPEGWWAKRQIKKYPLMRETVVAIAKFDSN